MREIDGKSSSESPLTLSSSSSRFRSTVRTFFVSFFSFFLFLLPRHLHHRHQQWRRDQSVLMISPLPAQAALLESEISQARVLWGKFPPPMKNRSRFFLAVLRARMCMYLADLGVNRKRISRSSLPYPFRRNLQSSITVQKIHNHPSTILQKVKKIF